MTFLSAFLDAWSSLITTRLGAQEDPTSPALHHHKLVRLYSPAHLRSGAYLPQDERMLGMLQLGLDIGGTSHPLIHLLL